MVTKPYTLLSHIPPGTLCFAVLGLKGAFSTNPLHRSSQPLSAFTWPGPGTYQSQQLTWILLPQGFRDSPHFFGQALQRDLQTLDLGSTTLLQYVDILLLCSSFCHNCLVHTATIKRLRQLGLQSWALQSTNCFHHCQLHGITYHSHIQNNSSSETSSLDPDPQAPNQEGTSFSIRSMKRLPNMGPKFCPSRKTSLASYLRKLR